MAPRHCFNCRRQIWPPKCPHWTLFLANFLVASIMVAAGNGFPSIEAAYNNTIPCLLEQPLASLTKTRYHDVSCLHSRALLACSGLLAPVLHGASLVSLTLRCENVKALHISKLNNAALFEAGSWFWCCSCFVLPRQSHETMPVWPWGHSCKSTQANIPFIVFCIWISRI